ncbi:MAG: hypothetical protein JF588_00615 [Caulobacterales bacterium]|nr:hypothetical protein [Caulobacterales bacterium]
MTHDHHAIHDDIAFMRSLAEEGRQAPMIGGPILLAIGLIFGAANGLGLAMTLSGAANGPGLILLPGGALALFLVVLGVLKRRQAAAGGTISAANRAAGALWRAIGMSSGLLFALMAVAAWRLGDWKVMAASPVLLFILYGAGWQVAATVGRQGWLKAVSLGSYLCAAAIALLASAPLASAAVSTAGLLLLMALPGYRLMRQARAAA